MTALLTSADDIATFLLTYLFLSTLLLVSIGLALRCWTFARADLRVMLWKAALVMPVATSLTAPLVSSAHIGPKFSIASRHDAGIITKPSSSTAVVLDDKSRPVSRHLASAEVAPITDTFAQQAPRLSATATSVPDTGFPGWYSDQRWEGASRAYSMTTLIPNRRLALCARRSGY